MLSSTLGNGSDFRVLRIWELRNTSNPPPQGRGVKNILLMSQTESQSSRLSSSYPSRLNSVANGEIGS